ncbi:hypothetical protein ACPYOC_09280 [Ornithinimicrobium sp. W1665]|uniref:hypothetical protein n=1 Tax=Ornithinimicrobium sp. W1665 TaxID=3416666 RepID=UPI003CEC90FB
MPDQIPRTAVLWLESTAPEQPDWPPEVDLLARAVRSLLEPGVREPLAEQARAAGAGGGWEQHGRVLADADGLHRLREPAP